MVSKALVVGAYQRKLEELAQQADITLTVIVPPAWREGANLTRLERVHTQGYDLLVAPLAFNGQFHLHFYPTLGRLLRQLRPDILHMDEEPYNLATWLALRQGRAAGARCLFFTWQNLQRRYPWPFGGFERANFRRASHAIAGNPSAIEVLRAKGYRGPVTVIPQFGVDPNIFSPRPVDAHTFTQSGASSSDGHHPSCFTIGYAGRLASEKGIDVLLRACAMLPPTVDWTLHLLGDGPEREHLVDNARELGIEKQVRFLGRVSSTQAPQYYRTLDVLVLPSLSRPNWIEQFGRVLTEAMACGVPVVGSRSGEIPWVIGDAGRIFPEGDADALASILAVLAGDPAQCATLAAAGRARVLAHFTQAQVAAETAAVYREMVSSGTRGSRLVNW
jgi:glycosyltransferase involved in cell wall biosynthesis